MLESGVYTNGEELDLGLLLSVMSDSHGHPTTVSLNVYTWSSGSVWPGPTARPVPILPTAGTGEAPASGGGYPVWEVWLRYSTQTA